MLYVYWSFWEGESFRHMGGSRAELAAAWRRAGGGHIGASQVGFSMMKKSSSLPV